ncbi:hypothetical protein K503DRAFT_766113 [Rhizopogon vinicolor AM-OR11-026]|uniref:Uncharacterized protein n=1 Tax=Rhizopogon vinicolor AM-OR11-026 TaxID=1314800 RepID=A0A1B7NEA5_9AGAM|nr:hypothetical protein K503DRAFT_766113 [Rhizopogon vinicolor AM-OR11-026]
MSNVHRFFSRHGRTLSQSSKVRPYALERSFHSPFIVLNNSPLTSSPSSIANVSPMSSPLYEKQHEHSPEPQVSSSGTRTYVVSEPDPTNTPYAVPSGAYPTSVPYVNYKSIEAPNPEGKHSSTSTSLPHYYTTRAVPRNAAGVGESAAGRYREAPGDMGRRGGSYGGLGLMDGSSTHQGAAELPDRNPSPDSDAAARWSTGKERK